MWNHYHLYLCVFCLGVIWFLGGCAENPKNEARVFVLPEEMTVSDTLEMTGVIRAGKMLEIRPNLAGQMLEILVYEKDFVQKGQVLFQILPQEFVIVSDSLNQILQKAKNQLSVIKKTSEQVKNQWLEAKKSTPTKASDLGNLYQAKAQELQKARFEVVQLEDNLRILEENSTPIEITAPTSGVIQKIYVTENERFSKPDSVSSKLEPSNLPKVWAEIQDVQQFVFEAKTENVNSEVNLKINWLSKGDSAKILLSFEKESYWGTIEQIISLSEKSKGYQVQIQFAPTTPNPKTRVGMTANTQIPIRPQTTLFLPMTCVERIGETTQIYIKSSDNQLEKRLVELGIQQGNQVEIRKGITKQTQVLHPYQTTNNLN